MNTNTQNHEEVDTMVTTNATTLRGELAPLYRRYPNQSDCQPAYIEINPVQRTVTANWNAEIGGAVPEAVYHRRVLRYDVSPYVTGTAIADLLGSERVLSLVERICNAHYVEWDGSNRVGQVLDPGALDELQCIVDAIADAPDNLISAYDPWDWLQDYDRETVRDMTDAEIDAEAERLVQEAHAEHVIIDGGADAIAQCLREWRDESN